MVPQDLQMKAVKFGLGKAHEVIAGEVSHKIKLKQLSEYEILSDTI